MCELQEGKNEKGKVRELGHPRQTAQSSRTQCWASESSCVRTLLLVHPQLTRPSSPRLSSFTAAMLSTRFRSLLAHPLLIMTSYVRPSRSTFGCYCCFCSLPSGSPNTTPPAMTWDGPRTPCSFWTPSIPPLEQRLPRRGLLVSTYRLLRATWMLITLPLHLTLLLASIVVGPTQTYERICSLACFHPLWNPRQRLVYPLLRRAIWAIADIGSADALTPNAKFKFPWWAWALEEFTVRVGRGARVRLRTSEVGMPAQAVESGWIQGDVVDMAGETEFEPVPCFWFEREDRRGLRSVYRKADEDERIVLYFVGGGYVYVLLLRFPLLQTRLTPLILRTEPVRRRRDPAASSSRESLAFVSSVCQHHVSFSAQGRRSRTG